MASDRDLWRSRCHRERGDRGAVVVLVAAALGAILVMVALVLDMGGARRDRDANQLATDATTLAAAAQLTDAGQSATAACAAAWRYVGANLPVAAGGTDPCASLAGACTPTTAREVELTASQHVITFTHPVPEGHPLLQGRAGEPLDGSPCERFGVRVEQDRANLIASGSVRLDVSAVGRLVPGVGAVAAPLVLLDPHACDTLYLSGAAKLRVETAGGAPGHIAIDSDGKDCTNRKVIFRVDGKQAEVHADVIAMWALADPSVTNAFTEGVTPQPIAASARVGRSAIDWRYSCDPAAGCPAEGPAHIDDLRAAWGRGPAELPPSPGVFGPADEPFTQWTTSGQSCSPTGTTVVPPGNWYIDCPGGLTSTGSITFEAGNIVSDGPIRAAGGLQVNCTADCTGPAPAPSILYLRSGDLRSPNDKGTIGLRETFVFLEDGTVDLTGNDELTWSAPDDADHPFDDLLLWTESGAVIRLQGSAKLALEGIFFAPNAELRLRGTADGTGLGTQIFVGSLDVGGTGDVLLKPHADRMLPLGPGRPVLIR